MKNPLLFSIGLITIFLPFILFNNNLNGLFDDQKKITYIDSDQYPDNETITINMAQFPHLPWDIFITSSSTTRQTFGAAVHGVLVGKATDENSLVKEYFCEKKSCYLNLKKGIMFHNNREVTAYDVEFSFTRQQLAKPGAHFLSAILEDLIGASDNEVKINKHKAIMITVNSIKYPSGIIKGIEVRDKYNLIFHLKRENNYFLQKASLGVLPIVPIEEFNKEYKDWKRWPIGFGKYKVIKADHINHQYVLEKVLKKENIPKYIRIIFSEKDIGDIKMILNHKRGNSAHDVSVVLPDIFLTGVFLFNYQTELGANPNFRKAISLAIDRQKISESTPIKNLLSPENQLILNSGWQKEYRAKIPIQRQNLKKAKELLNKIPHHLWKNKTFYIPTIWISDDPERELPYIKEIKRQLKALGISAVFNQYDPNYSIFKENDENVMIFSGFDAATEDIHKNLSYFKEGSVLKYSYPNDQEFNKLFEQSAQNFWVNPESSAKLSKYFIENCIAVPLFYVRMSFSYNSNRILNIGKQGDGMRLALYLWRIKLKNYK